MNNKEKTDLLQSCINFNKRLTQELINTKAEQELKLNLVESIKTLNHLINTLKKQTKLPIKTKLLSDYLDTTQKELDAYVEFIESKNIIPHIEDSENTEIEWYYNKVGELDFEVKQDCWLKTLDGEFIAFGSSKEINKKQKKMDSQNTFIYYVTDKSILLKRKEWLLKQLESLG